MSNKKQKLLTDVNAKPTACTSFAVQTAGFEKHYLISVNDQLCIVYRFVQSNTNEVDTIL